MGERSVIQIINNWLGHIGDGFEFDAVSNLTIKGGGQLQSKTVMSRNLFFYGVNGATIDGWVALDSVVESPFRWSNYFRNATISNLTGGGIPALTGKAAFAIHCATNCTFNKLIANNCDLSIDTAGAGGSDGVENCVFNDCETLDCKLELRYAVRDGIQFNRHVGRNLGGECVSVAINIGFGYDGGSLTTNSAHGFSFYSANPVVVTNTKVYTKNKQTVLMTGATTPQNNGNGNAVIYSP